MAGYPIEALKKAEAVTGLDIIPLQQNGITKQLERSIFDQAVIIKEAGSQSSGIIRKEGVFVLKSETQINFTLEAAAGRIVEDNEYIDSAEAASGWIVYVVNTSGIQHTVIHDANSWPINAGEILCFYWTGSRFTLHNIVINNLTVRGDTKLLEVPAVQTLVAENKLAVIGADGKIISTTVNDIVGLANVDGKINNALANYSTILKKIDFYSTFSNNISGYYYLLNTRVFVHIEIRDKALSDWEALTSKGAVPSPKKAISINAKGKTSGIYIFPSTHANGGCITQNGNNGLAQGTYMFDFSYDTSDDNNALIDYTDSYITTPTLDNALTNYIKSKEIILNFNIPNGDIGTRGNQIDITSDYGENISKIISMEVTNISNSNAFYPVLFSSGNTLYCNIYRCQSSFSGNYSVKIKISYL